MFNYVVVYCYVQFRVLFIIFLYNFYMTRLMLGLYAVGTGGERESVMLLIKNSLCVDGAGLAGGGQ